ncbi:hypothetical protein CRG98_003668 [Punica granatum]|uniref:Uncharacterized protein n=1 Tax=Punica granatum TaxID=22663 RepID=A0A2I0L5G7_PUNGR|nr:hypothetical protein CRG98_003668 [Punica granatum]
MWYLLPESSLDDCLVDMNTDPEVISMVELGLKLELATVYTEADRMKDSDDEGHEDFDVETRGIRNEVEDSEAEETERNEYDIGGCGGVNDEDNDEPIEVREQRKAFKMQIDGRKKRHAMRRKKKQTRQSNDLGDDIHIPKIPIDHKWEQSRMGKMKKKYRSFIPNYDITNITLSEDMIFANDEQFKEDVKSYAIVNGLELWWNRSYKINIEVPCKEKDCPWRIYGSWTRKNEGFVVKRFTN